MFIRHEALVDDSDQQVRNLADFTRVTNIKQRILELRVNTYVGAEDEGRSPSQYIAPAELTGADWEAVREHAGAAMARHYPEMIRATQKQPSTRAIARNTLSGGNANVGQSVT
jgi:hypothetical protein